MKAARDGGRRQHRTKQVLQLLEERRMRRAARAKQADKKRRAAERLRKSKYHLRERRCNLFDSAKVNDRAVWETGKRSIHKRVKACDRPRDERGRFVSNDSVSKVRFRKLRLIVREPQQANVAAPTQAASDNQRSECMLSSASLVSEARHQKVATPSHAAAGNNQRITECVVSSALAGTAALQAARVHLNCLICAKLLYFPCTLEACKHSFCLKCLADNLVVPVPGKPNRARLNGKHNLKTCSQAEPETIVRCPHCTKVSHGPLAAYTDTKLAHIVQLVRDQIHESYHSEPLEFENYDIHAPGPYKVVPAVPHMSVAPKSISNSASSSANLITRNSTFSDRSKQIQRKDNVTSSDSTNPAKQKRMGAHSQNRSLQMPSKVEKNQSPRDMTISKWFMNQMYLGDNRDHVHYDGGDRYEPYTSDSESTIAAHTSRGLGKTNRFKVQSGAASRVAAGYTTDSDACNETF